MPSPALGQINLKILEYQTKQVCNNFANKTIMLTNVYLKN